MSKVGYKSPPEHSRFKKGQSGNPRGRPKKAKTHDLIAIADQKVSIVQNGKRQHVTIAKAVLLKTANSAVGGDMKATKVFLDYLAQIGYWEKQHVESLPPVTFIVQGVMPEKVKKESASENEDAAKPEEKPAEKKDSSKS